MTTASSARSVLVTVCTYNERENLPLLIDAIHNALPSGQVLVIDDSSPDGTGELADQLAADRPWMQVLHRKGKLGLGTAQLAAMERGLQQGFERLITLDADFSHPPEVLPELVAAAEEVDVAIGSRYVAGGGIRGWPWHRHVMSRAINIYARCWLGLTTRDNSGAYRCYRTEVLKRLRAADVLSRGYSFQEEILFLLKVAGASFREVPITFVERQRGQSKINWWEVWSALVIIARLGCSRLFGTRRRNPQHDPQAD